MDVNGVYKMEFNYMLSIHIPHWETISINTSCRNLELRQCPPLVACEYPLATSVSASSTVDLQL
jgi:hypothetical protein